MTLTNEASSATRLQRSPSAESQTAGERTLPWIDVPTATSPSPCRVTSLTTAPSAPWTSRARFAWRPDVRVQEYICEENNRNTTDPTGTQRGR